MHEGMNTTYRVASYGPSPLQRSMTAFSYAHPAASYQNLPLGFDYYTSNPQPVPRHYGPAPAYPYEEEIPIPFNVPSPPYMLPMPQNDPTQMVNTLSGSPFTDRTWQHIPSAHQFHGLGPYADQNGQRTLEQRPSNNFIPPFANHLAAPPEAPSTYSGTSLTCVGSNSDRTLPVPPSGRSFAPTTDVVGSTVGPSPSFSRSSGDKITSSSRSLGHQSGSRNADPLPVKHRHDDAVSERHGLQDSVRTPATAYVRTLSRASDRSYEGNTDRAYGYSSGNYDHERSSISTSSSGVLSDGQEYTRVPPHRPQTPSFVSDNQPSLEYYTSQVRALQHR